jgi:hypothetical protein
LDRLVDLKSLGLPVALRGQNATKQSRFRLFLVLVPGSLEEI